MADERTKQQLINRRTTLVASLERTARFVENYSAERDAGQVQLRLENLNTVWTGLENVQIQLEDLEDTSEGMTNNLQFRSDNETRFFQVKATLQSYLPVVSSTSASSQSTYSGLSAIKLPTISLPEFDGDYNQWLTFHDTFSALIHDNAEVPAIQKFHYLRAALKGEAAQLVESIGISSANYSIAWQALISRYANDYLLKKRHLQALLDCPRMNTESATALHTIVDDYERHTKTLRQLGEPIDAWSTMLEHLLCQRLDDGTLKAWETFATTIENPDFNCLIGFLQKRIRVLESMSVNHQSHPVSNHQPPVFRRSPFNRTSTYAVTEMNQYKCHACDEHHLLFQCPQFGAMSPSERMNLVNELRLCHNCFNQNHIVRNCQSKFCCRHCKRRHHSMLHPGYHPNTDEQIPTTSHAMATPPAQEDVGSIVHTATASHTTTYPFCALVPQSNANVFLSTVVVLIVDSNGEMHPARALLDNGSQSNIISERLCQILRLKRKKINIPVFGVGQASVNVRHSVIANIKSRMNKFETDLEFLVMPHITIDLPATVAHRNKWNPPRNCFLADPTFDKTGSIDMLLGAEHFFNFVNSGNKIESAGNPTLIESVFGWIVTGRNQSQLVSYPAICHLAVKDTLNEDVPKRRKMVAAVQQISRVNVMFEIPSSYDRLLRVTVYCLRFIQACRTRVTSRQAEATKHPTVDEISMAPTKLVQLAQADGFAEELKDLEKRIPVSRRSPLRLLSPFINSNRDIRVGGRLRHSEQRCLIKHPIPLPSAHPFTRLIIRHFHEKLLHGGGRATLSALRQEYWPIQGYRTVKSVIRKCFRCTRAAPVPAKQKTGQLPLQQFTPTRPFTVTEVDYAGSMYLKPIHKRIGALKQQFPQFWRQWKTKYLPELQKEIWHIAPSAAFQPGRMVVIVDEFIAPVKWLLAKIVTTYPGVDGLTRVDDRRTSKGMIRKPITKICLLSYEEENEQQR